MNYLGIDNGVSGALALISELGHHVCHLPMPVVKTRKGNEVSVRDVAEWLNVYGLTAVNTTVIIEEPGGSKSAKAACSMAGSFHALRALFELRRFKLIRITPQAWQKDMLHCKSGDTKKVAAQLARSLWPDETWFRTPKCRTVDHNIIDAALIAEYGRRCRL